MFASNKFELVITELVLKVLKTFEVTQKSKLELIADMCAEPGASVEALWAPPPGPKSDHRIDAQRALASLYYFVRYNPTGRYRLDLMNPVERRLCLELFDLSKCEAEFRTRTNACDTSQNANQNAWRNLTLDDEHWELPEIFEDFPIVGAVQFDYVSTVVSQHEEAKTWQLTELNTVLSNEKMPEMSRLILFRHLICKYSISCSQAQNFLHFFHSADARVELAVAFFAFITDRQNFQQMCINCLSHDEWSSLLIRIGVLNICVFDPIVPASFCLDIEHRDEAVFAAMLQSLALQESGEWSEVFVNGKEASVESVLEELPNDGFLRLKFQIGEVKDVKLRRSCCAKTFAGQILPPNTLQNWEAIDDLLETHRINYPAFNFTLLHTSSRWGE